MASEPSWFVYMVRCRDGSLYTGVTRDVRRRVAEHNGDGPGARYTRARRPVCLVWFEGADNKSAAMRREAAIKRLPVAAKRALARDTLAAERDGRYRALADIADCVSALDD